MNNTTGDPEPLEPQPAYALVYGCILALGLPLNAVSLWILLRRHSLKSPSAVFMVNLAISDLLLIISLPMGVYFFATGSWPLGPSVCIFVTLLFINNIRSSSVFITFICVDRLLAVVYPLRSRHLRTSTNAWKAAVLVWALVLVLAIPGSMEVSASLENCSVPSCFDFRHCVQRKSGMVYLQPVLLLIMLAVNIVCTTLVSWTLRSRANESLRVNNKVNAMLIFIMNLVMFTICFLPMSVGYLMGAPARKPLLCLATMNCCLDPLLYYFSLDAFWKKKDEVDLAREREE